MFSSFVRLFFIHLFLLQINHAQDLSKWRDDLLKIYNGTIVYSPADFTRMYDNLDKSSPITRSLWGMMVIQTSFVDSNGEFNTPQIQSNLTEIFKANLKMSDRKSSSEDLYYAGRFAFYLLSYSTFHKLSVSFYSIFMEFRALLTAVISKRAGFQNEARAMLADGLSRPANKKTNTWNSYILQTAGISILSTLPQDLQYRVLLAKARILIRKDRIVEARQLIEEAKQMFPNGAAEANILEISIL
ncbi:MAG: hypothetical protein ACRC9L_06545 [Brevinema sp.]